MINKTCSRCKRDLPADRFSVKRGRPGQRDTLKSQCKECVAAVHRERYNRRVRDRGTRPAAASPGSKICNTCRLEKPISEFHPCCASPNRSWHWSSYCKPCDAQQHRARAARGYARPAPDLALALLEGKLKSVQDGVFINGTKSLPFQLTAEHIRELITRQSDDAGLRCAATGVTLCRGPGTPLSPSLDRIDCDLGYVPGNVRITSLLYNLARRRWADQEVCDTIRQMARALAATPDQAYGYRVVRLTPGARAGVGCIFEDEYRRRQHVWEALSRKTPGLRLRPSACRAGVVEADEALELYRKYHYLGGAHGLHLGLWRDSELVACITFRRPSRQGSGDWEIARMARNPDVLVQGCWSYLLQTAIRRYGIAGRVVSFSDNRLHTGAVYAKMGLKPVRDVPPDYYWVKDGVRHHKSALRKSRRERATGRTERELRAAQGYFRVWDAGKIKWELTV